MSSFIHVAVIITCISFKYTVQQQQNYIVIGKKITTNKETVHRPQHTARNTQDTESMLTSEQDLVPEHASTHETLHQISSRYLDYAALILFCYSMYMYMYMFNVSDTPFTQQFIQVHVSIFSQATN